FGVLGQQLVELAASLAQDLLRPLDLRLISDLGNLLDGAEQAEGQPTEGEEGALLTVRRELPRGGALAGLRLCAPLGGQVVGAPAFGAVGLDEALVLELLERRVDAARAGLPGALRALADLA